MNISWKVPSLNSDIDPRSASFSLLKEMGTFVLMVLVLIACSRDGTSLPCSAKDLGGEGDYVVYVGTLTTPLHNKWADAAIAYQQKKFPNMKLVADRFPGADEIDTSQRTTLDVIKAYPNLRGILGFGSNGPIGAGNAVRA